jgi:UDP-glucose 4-epimerase
VRQVIDTAARVEVAGRRPGDPAVLVASSDTIQQDLGWRPRYQQLDTIIASAWDWMVRRGDASTPDRAASDSKVIGTSAARTP